MFAPLPIVKTRSWPASRLSHSVRPSATETIAEACRYCQRCIASKTGRPGRSRGYAMNRSSYGPLHSWTTGTPKAAARRAEGSAIWWARTYTAS